jgi:hypothetical protein
MKKHILAAGAAVLAIGIAGIASAATAPCPGNFTQHPVSAKQIKSALTQAFVSCNNPGGNTSNAETEGGTESCYPAETFFAAEGSQNFGWEWGPKGKGDITFKAGKNKIHTTPVDLNPDPTAVDLYITVKMSDIRDNNGLADNTSGRVASLARATFVDRETTDAPMTVFDFPTSFPLPVFAGKVNHKISATVILNNLSQPALPRCTNIELISIRIQDPNKTNFASMGTFLP